MADYIKMKRRLINIIQLIGDRLFGNDYRIRESDTELRIQADINENDFYKIRVNNDIRKTYPLAKVGSNLIWTLPPFIDNERMLISIESSTLGNVNFTTNQIIVRDFYLEKDFEQYDMYNDIPIIELDGRKILMPQGKIITIHDDINSQFLMFKFPRFINGVDISTMTIGINYINALNEHDIFVPVNVSKSLDFLRFAWLINNSVSVADGTIHFEIEILGTNEKGNPYIWKTLPSEIIITKSLDFDVSEIIERYPNILQQLRMDLNSLENRVAYLEQNPSGSGEGTTDHAKLTHLDYANSGHIGFASTSHLNLKVNRDNVLTLDNTTEFTPQTDYQPATRKFVLDSVGSSGESRDFHANPIKLDSEVTGILPLENFDNSENDRRIGEIQDKSLVTSEPYEDEEEFEIDLNIISADRLPIDNETIKINENGKIYADNTELKDMIGTLTNALGNRRRGIV